MNDEAINSICNTLLSIKSDIRELKQNYNTFTSCEWNYNRKDNYQKKDLQNSANNLNVPIYENQTLKTKSFNKLYF